MSKSTPDLTTYHAVHHALRAASHLQASALAVLDPRDRIRVRAIQRYWHGYSNEVDIHHTIEDNVIFPAIASRVPVASIHMDRAADDHQRLDALMATARTAMDALTSDGRSADPAEAAAAFMALAAYMDEHLGFEDDDVLPLIERHFTAEEYSSLENEANRALGIGKQAAFTVPFVLWFATPADRTTMLSSAPKAFALLYRMTRRRHARLVREAFGTDAAQASGSPVDDQVVS